MESLEHYGAGPEISLVWDRSTGFTVEKYRGFISALSVEHHISLGTGNERPDSIMIPDIGIHETSAGIPADRDKAISRID